MRDVELKILQSKSCRRLCLLLDARICHIWLLYLMHSQRRPQQQFSDHQYEQGRSAVSDACEPDDKGLVEVQ